MWLTKSDRLSASYRAVTEAAKCLAEHRGMDGVHFLHVAINQIGSLELKTADPAVIVAYLNAIVSYAMSARTLGVSVDEVDTIIGNAAYIKCQALDRVQPVVENV